MAMAPSSSSTLPCRPLPPGLRMTPANKVGEKKDEPNPEPSRSGDESSRTARLTARTSQAESKRTRLTFAAGTNAPPSRHVPLRPRTAGIDRADDGDDQYDASESDEEGDCSLTSGTGQENERPTSTDGLWPSPPPHRPVSPKNRAMFVGQLGDESMARKVGEEGVGGRPSPPPDRLYGGRKRPSTPRLARAVLANVGGSSNRNRTPSPTKRKHMQREKTLDSEYRRDLLAFEGIDVRDFQEEADAQEGAEEEESPKKKGKRAAPYESPDRPLIEDNVPVKNLRARIIAQTGFATHCAKAVSDTLEEEDLFTPEVEHIEQNSRYPVIIPVRHGSHAQYPAGSTADWVGVQLGKRRRRYMIAQRARIVREQNEEALRRREDLVARAADKAHAAAVAHAAALANDSGDEADKEGDRDLALHRC